MQHLSVCRKRIRLSEIVEKMLQVFHHSPVRYFRVEPLAHHLHLLKRRVKDVVHICSGIGLCKRGVLGRGWQWCGGIPSLAPSTEHLKYTLERLSYHTLKHILATNSHIFTMESLMLLPHGSSSTTKMYDVLSVFAVLGIVKFHKHKWYELTL